VSIRIVVAYKNQYENRKQKTNPPQNTKTIYNNKSVTATAKITGNISKKKKKIKNKRFFL